MAQATDRGRASGIAAMEQRNITKAALLYDFIDGSQLYHNTVDKNLPLAHERALLPARRVAQRSLPERAHRLRACCSSKATNRSAACAPASTTPCRWRACRRWCNYMREFEKTQA